MTKRQLVWIAAAALGVVAMLSTVWSTYATNKILLNEAQLQERLNRQLPREVKGITIDRMQVSIADKKIALFAQVRAGVLHRTIAANVTARGAPNLDAERGELYFDVDQVKLADIKIGDSELRSEQTQVEANRPLAIMKEVAANTIAAGIKFYLAARPVYRFKDDLKGVVLKAAITDVNIEGNAIAIELSLVRVGALAVVSLVLLLSVLVGIAVLVRNRSWGARVRA
jgi:hypothetical protein